MDKIYIPEVNPISFVRVDRANTPGYNTRFMENWTFEERLHPWQSRECDIRIWQTTDTIKLQFESEFNPIIVKLLDEYGTQAIVLPALIGLPNEFIAGTFSYEVAMSLAGLPTGYYSLMMEAGFGTEVVNFYGGLHYISEEVIDGTVRMEYSDSKKFHKDVIWATGIKFQLRVHAHFGFLGKASKDEAYRNEKNSPTLLNSKSSKQYPLIFGSEFGISDDLYNIIDEAWGLDTVAIDGVLFGLAERGKVETFEIGEGEYPKRGFQYLVEPGINRNSRIFAKESDPNKKLIANIVVESTVFGDLSNQGSSNEVPIYNVSIE